MNKKIPIVAAIVIAAIGLVIVGSKAYFGDAKTELPAEEKIEKSLNIEEKNTGAKNSETAEINEANEAGESKRPNP